MMLTIPLIKQMTSDELFYYIVLNSIKKPIPNVLSIRKIRNITQDDKLMYPALSSSELNTAVEYCIDDNDEYKMGSHNILYLRRLSLSDLNNNINEIEINELADITHQEILNVVNQKLGLQLTLAETDYYQDSQNQYRLSMINDKHVGLIGELTIKLKEVVIEDLQMTYNQTTYTNYQYKDKTPGSVPSGITIKDKNGNTLSNNPSEIGVIYISEGSHPIFDELEYSVHDRYGMCAVLLYDPNLIFYDFLMANNRKQTLSYNARFYLLSNPNVVTPIITITTEYRV